MNEHRKKMTAPIVVTVILIVYYIVYFGVLMALLSGIWRILLGIFPVAFSGVMIMVCIERIKEIRNGEEDDIGKY